MRGWLALLAFWPALALPQDACTVSNTIEFPMAPLREQGETGFCYVFAARNLLESFSGRLAPDDQLSVLDIAGLANGALYRGGDTHQVLHRILDASRKVALEKCIPFEKSLSNDPKRRKKFRESYDRVQANYSLAESEAAAMKAQLQLEATVEEIKAAFTKREFSFALKDVTVTKECQKSRVTLPEFVVKREGGPFAKAEVLRKALQKAFDHKSAASLDLCTKVPPPGQDIDQCGAHAIVVSGIRTRCCGEVDACFHEYRIIDSAKIFKEWVDEKTLALYVSLFKYHSQVLWLEKPSP